ncbi:MAG: glycoside hydrolase family 2 TIM barrel-domain containing protein [Bacteroidota bacterium]|nr:glycoside hydrolase family 2 TIM barrel-domain containing protein [Bacteroidota bacterium]
MNKLLFRSSIYLLVSVLVATTLFSQQLFLENGTPSHPNVLSYNSSARSIIDLSGEWNYSLDNGISWKQVKIPAAANYEGKIVYRKKFSVDELSLQNNAFTIVCYGINYQAEVFINETFVGRHEGGYTSFELSVPDNIIQIGSENVIRVVVDNLLNHRSTFPLRPQVSGWKNYNGIVRDIFIVAAPKLRIEKVGVVVEAIEPKSTKLIVTTTVSAKDLQAFAQLSNKTFQLSVETVEAANGIVVGKPTVVSVVPQPNSSAIAQISISISSAKLWSPDSPELYSIKVSLLAVEGKKDSLLDAVSVTTGIRTFTKDKNNLLFNGAPINLRGVVWIEDSEFHGSALTYEEMERDVALIKNLGANTVRVGFHPPHPFFIQLCDRYGLLVLEEIPNFEIPAKILDDENYRSLVNNYLKDMIERDRHNPSVIAWGLGEGSGFTGDTEKNIVSQLHHTAKSIDDRLTYFITRGAEDDDVSSADICAISFSNVDIKKFRLQIAAFKESNPKKPLIVSGYGKAIEDGNRNGYSDPNSQESQARYIQQRYAVIKDMNLAGSMIFAFNDFKSDRPIMHIKPTTPLVHTVGIVELDREKKSAYDVVHSIYHDQKISALPIGNYVPASPYVYVVIGLSLLIIAAWLVNGNRRFRESTRRAIFNSYNFFADIRDQFTLPLFHTTVTAFIIAITFSVIFSSILHHFKTSVALDYILSYLLSDDFKKIVIEMSWNPMIGVGYFSTIIIGWFLGLTVLVKILALMARVKIRLFHSYSIVVWTALPWLFFIPVGMILYRVLESEVYVPWILGLVVLMSVWVYFRTLKGISVIYHIYTPKMYMIGVTVVLVISGGFYAYLDYMYSLSLYAEYFATHILPFVN